MEDAIHFELCHHAFEQRLVGDRPGDLAIDLPGDRFVQAGDVDGDDVAIAALGEAIDEPVADLAAGAGDDRDRFPHQLWKMASRSSGRFAMIDATTASSVASRQIAAPTKWSI